MTVACRLLAASAALRSFSDLTVPLVPSPKVIVVAVPSPVAPIVSVKPPSAVVPPLRAVVAGGQAELRQRAGGAADDEILGRAGAQGQLG